MHGGIAGSLPGLSAPGFNGGFASTLNGQSDSAAQGGAGRGAAGGPGPQGPGGAARSAAAAQGSGKGSSLLEELNTSVPGLSGRKAAAARAVQGWASISGLDSVKQLLQEVTVLPNLRPDLFKVCTQNSSNTPNVFLRKAVIPKAVKQ